MLFSIDNSNIWKSPIPIHNKKFFLNSYEKKWKENSNEKKIETMFLSTWKRASAKSPELSPNLFVEDKCFA